MSLTPRTSLQPHTPRLSSSRARLGIAALGIALAALVSAAGCATRPFSGAQISDNVIAIGGLTDVAGVRVRLSAYDWNAARFVALTDVFAQATPSFAAGAICPNSPALYRYDGAVTLNWPFYWRRNPTLYQTKVKATQITAGETPLMFTDNPAGVDCMIANAFNSTCDFFHVAANVCGYDLHEAVVSSTSSSPWNP